MFLYCKLFNKEERADEYDDMFMSECNSIVCLNRRLNRRLNVGRTSQWYILMALSILQLIRAIAKTQVARVNA